MTQTRQALSSCLHLQSGIKSSKTSPSLPQDAKITLKVFNLEVEEEKLQTYTPSLECQVGLKDSPLTCSKPPAKQAHIIKPENKDDGSWAMSKRCETQNFVHPHPAEKPLHKGKMLPFMSQSCGKHSPYFEKTFSKSSSVLVKGRFLTKSLPDSDKSSSSSSSLSLLCQGWWVGFGGRVSFVVFLHLETSTQRPPDPRTTQRDIGHLPRPPANNTHVARDALRGHKLSQVLIHLHIWD